MKKFSITDPIYVVDDEEDICDLFLELGASLGLKILTFVNPRQALAELKADHPFLIISDFRMPVMNGLEFCEQIRQTGNMTPFVMVSGHADKAMAMDGLKAGVSELLEKPLTLSQIEEFLTRFASKKEEALEAEKRELDEILPFFIEEATDMLQDFDQLILRLEEMPLDPAVIDSMFRKIHSLKGGAASLPGAKLLAELSHDFESALSQIKKGELAPSPGAISLFLESYDFCNQLLRLLSERIAPSAEVVAQVDSARQRLGQLKSATSQIQATVAAPAAANSVDLSSDDEGVFVSNEKLDSFMKVSGELIALKNNFDILAREGSAHSNPERLEKKLTEFAQSLNKVTDQLQEQIMSVRKVSLERTFSKVPRVVRQTAQSLGKKVRLQTQGLEIGIDKNVAKSLSASIIHIVRNSVDHGIETPDVRSQRNKPSEGLVTIEAGESQGVVRVVIRDDGNGIDAERVLKKAVENGTISAEAARTMNEEQKLDLIFLPGLSTKSQVTAISGRGVGMDVVRSSLLSHQGKVRIESKPGQGSAFILEIPIPRSVMVEQTVLARSGSTVFALPLTAVSQIVSARELIFNEVNGTRMTQLNGTMVPIQSYDELIERKQTRFSDDLSSKTAILVQRKGQQFALLTDKIEGQLEAVIRPFDGVVKTLPGLIGTTVLGNEAIAYVVDPERLLQLVYPRQEH